MYVRMYVTRNGNTVSKLAVIVAEIWTKRGNINLKKKTTTNKQNNNPEKLVAYERCKFVCNRKLEKANRTRHLFDKLASQYYLGENKLYLSL